MEIPPLLFTNVEINDYLKSKAQDVILIPQKWLWEFNECNNKPFLHDNFLNINNQIMNILEDHDRLNKFKVSILNLYKIFDRSPFCTMLR